jgi:hypothetical protein
MEALPHSLRSRDRDWHAAPAKLRVERHLHLPRRERLALLGGALHTTARVHVEYVL